MREEGSDDPYRRILATMPTPEKIWDDAAPTSNPDRYAAKMFEVMYVWTRELLEAVTRPKGMASTDVNALE